jgi:hypothetical protein
MMHNNFGTITIFRRYVSALLEDGEKPNLQTAVSSGWPASLHLIGKVPSCY